MVEPLDITAWRVVGPRRGANPGGVFRADDGSQWYIKFPQVHAEQARSEVLADAIYQALDIPVKDSILIVRQDRLGIASPMVDGTRVYPLTLAHHRDIQRGFVADAYLAHWDVCGLAYDNFLHGGGRVVRMDTGGAMGFRAQGRRKPFPADRVEELLTLRAPGRPGCAVFAGVTVAQQAASARHLVATLTDALLRMLIADAGFTDARAQVYLTALRGRRQVLARLFRVAR